MFGSAIKGFEIIRPTLKRRKIRVQFRSVDIDACHHFPTVSCTHFGGGMAGRVCDLTGKKANNGYKVSFSNHRTKHLQGVNLQYKRLWWEEGNRFVKLRLSTKALKTVEKNGLQAMAKKAGIDLADY